MKINFKINDYLLAWQLLFKASFCKEVQELKMKLYRNHPKEYMDLKNDYKKIINQDHNYIPDNDLIYDYVFSSDIFNILKEETEKYYHGVVKAYNRYKKKINNEIFKVLRFNLISEYDLYIVHPKMSSKMCVSFDNKQVFIWGSSYADDIDIICNIIQKVVENYIDAEEQKKEMTRIISEMAILGELATKIDNSSRYKCNKFDLCKDIYPYFLMYMGADNPESLISYMMRDKIVFEVDRYQMETKLQKINLKEFIDFCYNNWNHLVKIT